MMFHNVASFNVTGMNNYRVLNNEISLNNALFTYLFTWVTLILQSPKYD